MTHLATTTEPAHAMPKGHAGFPQLVRSEWTKLRSIRSTWICLALVVVLSIAFAIIFPAAIADHWSRRPLADKLTYDPVSITQFGVIFSQLVVGVLGAMAITAEYSTGSIRTTLTSVPRRSTLVAAKAVVLAVVVFIVAEITTFASFMVGRSILLAFGGKELPVGSSLLTQIHSSAIPVVSLSSPGVTGAIFRGGLYLTLIALVSLGIGLLLRSTAGSISLFVGIFLIVPLLMQALPSSISHPIEPKLPSNLGAAMTSTHARATEFGGTLLHPWSATVLLAVYGLALIALGTWSFIKRDA